MSTVEALRQHAHDVVHQREEGLQRLTDPEIMEKARKEARTVLTFDLDFGDVLAIGGQSYPSVIIFRLHNETPTIVTPALFRVLADEGDTIAEGAITIVEEMRYRIRRLPIE